MLPTATLLEKVSEMGFLKKISRLYSHVAASQFLFVETSPWGIGEVMHLEGFEQEIAKMLPHGQTQNTLLVVVFIHEHKWPQNNCALQTPWEQSTGLFRPFASTLLVLNLSSAWEERNPFPQSQER